MGWFTVYSGYGFLVFHVPHEEDQHSLVETSSEYYLTNGRVKSNYYTSLKYCIHQNIALKRRVSVGNVFRHFTHTIVLSV